MCDQIADAVLDECLKEDSESRAACEVLATRGHLLVAGEITSKHEPYVPEIVKKILEDTGYQAEDITIDVQIHKQSPDIARAVDHPQGRRKGLSEEAEARGNGAGDQGVMIGYACNETAQLMQMPVVLAHRIVRELSACRRSEYIKGLLPDGKAQVTVEYEDGKPLRVDSVIVSCQHAGDKNLRKLEQEIRNKVLFPALRPLSADEDTGVTGRKLMVDSYGSMVPHGGGAFSGKDCSKVDRSGAYMARYIAKNLVAANLADRCQVSLAYAIGMAEPVMVQVETFGTGRVCADDCLAAAIPLVFGLSPKQICDTFRLKRPIFQRTAVYGHFGRKEFPWERTDKTEELRNAVM